MPPSRRLADLGELLETNYQKLAKFRNRLPGIENMESESKKDERKRKLKGKNPKNMNNISTVI
ncbi:MAG: hypothetical protein Fur006_05850 [Coleofasciculaceae cyanobacterium]